MPVEETNEDYKISIYNRLIDIAKEKEEIWKYHPSNPDRIDVVDVYEKLEREENELTHLVDALI